MDIRRVMGPLLAEVMAVGIGAAVYVSYNRNAKQEETKAAMEAVVDVRGMIGSEKESFFRDQKVQDLLAAKGLRVNFEKVGSREIASRDLKGYDFGFPAGAPAAISLQKKAQAKQVYSAFFTPMAVASWEQLMPIMLGEGIVKKMNDTYHIVDMKRLLEMIEKGVRWRDLKDNTAFATGKSILIASTDVRKSNSAAMYLALASYVRNDNNVIDNSDQIDKVLPFLTAIFQRQGLQESSSAGPFEDYTTMGMGKAPLVMIYV